MSRNVFLILKLLTLAFVASVAWGQTATTSPATRSTEPAASQPAELLAGAIWQYSADGGATFSSQWPAEATGKVSMIAKAGFQAGDMAGCQALELTHNLDPKSNPVFTINGKTLEGPKELPAVTFRTFPAIPPNIVVQGNNVLTITWQPIQAATSQPAASKPPQFSLTALRAGDLKVVTGPILGARGDDYITVSCRTNMPAKVTVRLMGGFSNRHSTPIRAGTIMTWQEFTKTSPPGLFSQLRLEGLRGMGTATYQLQIETPDGAGKIESGPWSIAPLTEGRQPLQFVAMGDNRTNPGNWALVAAAALKARPQFVIHTGDLVERGLQDWRWNEELFDPAAVLLSTVPTFAVPGNHEGGSPITALLFAVPPDGTPTCWQQTIGPVQLIGIDGAADWSAGSENVRWLESVLAASKTKFIFLISHYPAWSSGPHETLDAEGQPKERPTREGQAVLWPLLVKYKATAMISGHDHFYERSEPPGGVTMIVTGGAGAPLYKPVANAKAQNPYSKIVSSNLHYCLFTVEDDRCTMQAFTPTGEVLDTQVWSARSVEGAALTTAPAAQ
jgi:3',5'-cyclic AMP phosphodiesterase CpdA